MTLIDSNILIDILGGDPVWSESSVRRLADCASRGALGINDIVYAELAAGFTEQELLDREIDALRLTIAPMSKGALFLAGQAFRRYRAGGGTRANVLADFFIGAHASVEGWPILTRDAKRYRTYFPSVAVLG
ncbi:MAG: type II toxin-antitoxin system VapC family toxin [Roseiarcus sp.]